MPDKAFISIVIPAYNEEENIRPVYDALRNILADTECVYEIIFVDDGSQDGTLAAIEQLRREDPRVQYLQFSRNFGKELAISAGIMNAQGDAIIMLDCDLQHPPELIPRFIEKWRAGGEVVIGVRNRSRSDSLTKRLGSHLYYRIINAISETKTVRGATDFRLLDRRVADELNNFTEKSRLTRGLIDWLGFRREYVRFDAADRANGQAKYNLRKLLTLAVSAFISMSFLPLKVAGYLGLSITVLAGLLGLFILVEKYALRDPWGLHISGTATLAVILMFMIGIVLACLGLIALYIANIHREVTNRPLYVVRKRS